MKTYMVYDSMPSTFSNRQATRLGAELSVAVTWPGALPY